MTPSIHEIMNNPAASRWFRQALADAEILETLLLEHCDDTLWPRASMASEVDT